MNRFAVTVVALLAMFSLVLSSAAFAQGKPGGLPPGENDAKAAIEKSPRHGEYVDIAVAGRERITNVAFGANTTHADIMAQIRAATGAEISVDAEAPTVTFPTIATARLDRLGLPARTPLSAMIGDLVRAF